MRDDDILVVVSKVESSVKGIRVDVPSEMTRSDYNELIGSCVRFDNGRLCNMGVGETRIFLVDPSHIVEANQVLKRYGVEAKISKD